jgi:hypothetical protein
VGGKLFNTTTRLNLAEYLDVESKIRYFLLDNRISYASIEYIRDKISFGDLDIVVSHDYDIDYLKSLLSKQLNVTEFHLDGHIFSFNFKGFQVDFIKIEFSLLVTSSSYFSWGDLGNLMGRIATQLGFKLGFRGLFYTYCDAGEYVNEILVTEDFGKAIEFIGYDYAKWCRGFNSEKAMWDFVIDNPLYNKAVFEPATQNSKSRYRDRTRIGYGKFINYLQTLDKPQHFWSKWESEKAINKARATFPEFTERLRNSRRDNAERIWSKHRFGSIRVREILNLPSTVFKEFMHWRDLQNESKTVTVEETDAILLQSYSKFLESNQS